MSTASNFVTRVDEYRERAPISTTFYPPEEQIVRKPEHAQSSFVQTIVGRRGGLRSILSPVEAVAPTNATLLITREKGAGKEIIPRAIPQPSPRPRPELVQGDCAAMPAGPLPNATFS